MCRECSRSNVGAVYTSELDVYIAALVQEVKAINKDSRFLLQDNVLEITGPLCMMFEHFTAMSDSSPTKDTTPSQSPKPVASSLVLYTVLCKSNESEMWEFCSLSPQTFKENSPKSLSIFSQYLECYFFKTKEEYRCIFLTRTKIPYRNDDSGCSMQNIVQCTDQFQDINVLFTCKQLHSR